MLPALVYETRDEILKYLGFRHITGVKEWGPLEKARYLYSLTSVQPYSTMSPPIIYRELAKTIGTNVQTVKKLLTGLAVYEYVADVNFYDIPGLEENFAFSVLTTALGNPKINTHIGLSTPPTGNAEGLKHDELKELMTWMYKKTNGKTVLGESRNLAKLGDVISHPMSLAQLRVGDSLDEASLYSSGPINTYRTLVEKAKSHLHEAWNNFPKAESALERSDEDTASDIQGQARLLYRAVRDTLDEKEDLA